jgi:N6-L-threonylcarbamoyladenine synthase
MVDKTIAAVKERKPVMTVLAGGVAANSRLRELMAERMKEVPDCELVIPPLKYCTDNAAMIGGLGYHYFRHGLTDNLDLPVGARLPPDLGLFPFAKHAFLE